MVANISGLLAEIGGGEGAPASSARHDDAEVAVDARDNYARYVRPAVARRLRALGLDVEFLAASGDRLTAAAPLRHGTEVIDFVGGYGASLFGHNHPALVAVAKAALLKSAPFSAQASVRSSTAALAARLSDKVGSTTGASYVVTLGSTGADAVEAAMKHAAVAQSRRLAVLHNRLETDLRRANRDGYADHRYPDCAESVAEVLRTSLAVVADMRQREPIFVSLQGAFHGKTAGACAISDHKYVPDDLVLPGPARLRLAKADWEPQRMVTALDAEIVVVKSVDLDHAGALRAQSFSLSPIAACFAEPIQGEGGVHEVPGAVLQGLRLLADRHNAALVFDEIQSGMGRTGSFLASTRSGVHADYYLLSKSLGGGLAKVSALLVQSDSSVDDFGLYHTSTFAEDASSARVALAALDLASEITPDVELAAAELERRLADVLSRWPDVFVETRGRGLMRGIELAAVTVDDDPISELLGEEQLGYVVAGYLLYQHGVRVLPTLSAPLTLRIQPSAFMSEQDMDRLVVALDGAAGLVRRGDFGRLMAHLGTPVNGFWRPPQFAPPPIRGRSRRRPETGKVAFLANMNSAADLRHLMPSFAEWSDEQLETLLDRTQGELGPHQVGSTSTVISPTGQEVAISLIAVPLTSSQIVRCQRSGQGAFLRAMVLDGVRLAAEQGASVVGLGGYTSIVTAAGRDVVEDEIRVTTGNSLTAACVLDQLHQVLDASDRTDRRVAIVGAVGNIGTAMARLLAPKAESLTLIGQPGSRSRLLQVSDGLPGAAVAVSEDLRDLRDATIVVTATNAPGVSVKSDHLADDRPVIVCDLAVPGDVDATVADMENVSVIAGGRIRLPNEQEVHVPASGLPRGVVFACLAETLLLGLEPATPSPSYGPLTESGIEQARALARRHTFMPHMLEQHSGPGDEPRRGGLMVGAPS
ncbi:aminotransferase class III-fold pyridoxal phosphate-dependent enzyme [Mycobacterium sp.]|uniref:aminotransferase class III-fold pyridoxal phosphate-dependent enzyme n=1 Tax=Mycobacterium sp. TaxID=1785 RepID=UPI003BABE504